MLNLRILALTLLVALTMACKTQANVADSEAMATSNDRQPDPPPEMLMEGMAVDVCPKDFVCATKSRATGKWIITSLPASYFSKRFQIKVGAQTYKPFGGHKDTYLGHKNERLQATTDNPSTFVYRKLPDGSLMIKLGYLCLASTGYKNPPIFTNCNLQDPAQKMQWNPDNNMVNPNGSFIKNQNLCLDVSGGNQTILEGENTLIFFNCKDHPGEASTNFNQRFKAIYMNH